MGQTAQNSAQAQAEGGKLAKLREQAAAHHKEGRTKAAVKKCNVGGDFYGALDKVVREMIASAEARAIGNKRKTLKPVDL